MGDPVKIYLATAKRNVEGEEKEIITDIKIQKGNKVVLDVSENYFFNDRTEYYDHFKDNKKTDGTVWSENTLSDLQKYILKDDKNTEIFIKNQDGKFVPLKDGKYAALDLVVNTVKDYNEEHGMNTSYADANIHVYRGADSRIEKVEIIQGPNEHADTFFVDYNTSVTRYNNNDIDSRSQNKKKFLENLEAAIVPLPNGRSREYNIYEHHSCDPEDLVRKGTLSALFKEVIDKEAIDDVGSTIDHTSPKPKPATPKPGGL